MYFLHICPQYLGRAGVFKLLERGQHGGEKVLFGEGCGAGGWPEEEVRISRCHYDNFKLLSYRIRAKYGCVNIYHYTTSPHHYSGLSPLFLLFLLNASLINLSISSYFFKQHLQHIILSVAASDLSMS